VIETGMSRGLWGQVAGMGGEKTCTEIFEWETLKGKEHLEVRT